MNTGYRNTVEKAWHEARDDDAFWEEFHALAKDYVGRPSPLYYAKATTPIHRSSSLRRLNANTFATTYAPSRGQLRAGKCRISTRNLKTSLTSNT